MSHGHLPQQAASNPFYQDAQVTLLQGDAMSTLFALEAESVQTVVTSPPYWGLRDYGIDGLPWGGSPDCDHRFELGAPTSETNYVDKRRWQHTRNGRDEEQPPEKRVGWKREKVEHGQFCECGAWLGSLGLEPTPELWVHHMTLLFAEVRRVLRNDGTLWLNLGDAYAHPTSGGGGTVDVRRDGRKTTAGDQVRGRMAGVNTMSSGLKPKDLVGMPWMLAFALRADGWYLRSDIIWSKPNPMPESVTDRPTKAHEYLFLLSKSERYYYDAGAIREPQSDFEIRYASRPRPNDKNGHQGWTGKHRLLLDGRNKRSVWEIPTAPYPEAHFATFPPDLIKPCILAGCAPIGVVLDPFVGSGTTALVAKELGRKAIGIDLNPAYLELARKRLGQETIWGIPA